MKSTSVEFVFIVISGRSWMIFETGCLMGEDAYRKYGDELIKQAGQKAPTYVRNRI